MSSEIPGGVSELHRSPRQNSVVAVPPMKRTVIPLLLSSGMFPAALLLEGGRFATLIAIILAAGSSVGWVTRRDPRKVAFGALILCGVIGAASILSAYIINHGTGPLELHDVPSAILIVTGIASIPMAMVRFATSGRSLVSLAGQSLGSKMRALSRDIGIRSAVYTISALFALGSAFSQFSLVRAMTLFRGSETTIEIEFDRVTYWSLALILTLPVTTLTRELSLYSVSRGERRLAFVIIAGCMAIFSTALIIRIAWRING